MGGRPWAGLRSRQRSHALAHSDYSSRVARLASRCQLAFRPRRAAWLREPARSGGLSGAAEENGGRSGVWLPPPQYRDEEACNQESHPDADLYPVPGRRGIPVSNPIRPVKKTIIEVPDFSLDQAMPQLAAAIDEQIDCDDASDDFIKEKLHSTTVHRGAAHALSAPPAPLARPQYHQSPKGAWSLRGDHQSLPALGCYGLSLP